MTDSLAFVNAEVGIPGTFPDQESSKETFARLETGKMEPPLELIERLALALGKRLQDFAEA